MWGTPTSSGSRWTGLSVRTLRATTISSEKLREQIVILCGASTGPVMRQRLYLDFSSLRLFAARALRPAFIE